MVGLEPTSLAAADFKSAEFTDFSTRALLKLVVPLGLEPRLTDSKSVVLPLHYGTI